MVRHWYRLKEQRWFRSAVINGIGAVLTAAALIVIAATKFTHGAWLILLLVPLFLLLFSRIHGHYEELAQDMSLHGATGALSPMPKRHTVVMLVSGVHKGVMHALDYARVISGGDVQSVYVDCEGPDKADDMRRQWAKYLPDIPLTILPSPGRDLVEPVVNYLRTLRAGNNNLVTVMIPEFVNGAWWTQLLHRRMAAKLKAALLYQCYCPVVSVPSRRTRPVHISSTHHATDKLQQK
jgi:hypothetical protein